MQKLEEKREQLVAWKKQEKRNVVPKDKVSKFNSKSTHQLLQNPIQTLEVSKFDSQFALMSSKDSVSQYSFKQGKFISKFSGGEPVNDAKFFYDTDKKALISQGTQIKALDLSSNEARVLANVNLDSYVTCLQCHPLSQFVLAGTKAGTWNFIDIETQRVVESVKTELPITAFAIHTFGHMLASGHANGSIKIWDLRTQRAEFEINNDFSGAVQSLEFSFKATHLIASAKESTASRLYSIAKIKEEGGQILEHAQQTRMSTFDPSGTYIAVCLEDNGIDIFGYKVHDQPVLTLKKEKPQVASFSSDGSFLAVGDVKGVVEVFSV